MTQDKFENIIFWDIATYAILINYSAAGVSSVNQQVGSGGISRRIADQVHISTLQLLGITVSSHGDHAHPQVLDIFGHEVRQSSVDITRGDGVDTSKVAPLVSQRLGHVNAASLGDVIGGLFLGEVGNVTRHGCGDDERSAAAFLEVGTDGFGAVEGSVEIGLDDFVPRLGGAVEDTCRFQLACMKIKNCIED